MRILLFLSAILAALTGAVGPARATIGVAASTSATSPSRVAAEAGSPVCLTVPPLARRTATDILAPVMRWAIDPATPRWMLRPRE